MCKCTIRECAHVHEYGDMQLMLCLFLVVFEIGSLKLDFISYNFKLCNTAVFALPAPVLSCKQTHVTFTGAHGLQLPPSCLFSQYLSTELFP